MNTAADEVDSVRFARFGAELARNQRGVIRAIRAGFSSTVLDDASAFFDVPVARIQAIARVPGNVAETWERRKAKLDAAASERIWRLAEVYGMARDMFEDEAAARAWLRRPNLTFGGDAPMDWLDTEPGGDAVRQVINAIVTGGPV